MFPTLALLVGVLALCAAPLTAAPAVTQSRSVVRTWINSRLTSILRRTFPIDRFHSRQLTVWPWSFARGLTRAVVMPEAETSAFARPAGPHPAVERAGRSEGPRQPDVRLPPHHRTSSTRAEPVVRAAGRGAVPAAPRAGGVDRDRQPDAEGERHDHGGQLAAGPQQPHARRRGP